MTRRLLPLAVVLAAVALAGCGGADDGQPASSAAATGHEAFPVTIEHKFGTAEIAERPERVAVVGYTEQDALLALGVEPVAVREFFGGYDWKRRPWARGVGGAQPEVLAADQIDFEAVAAQRPDLIVGINSGMTKGDYGKLSRIAPTIAQSGDYVDYGMPWDEQTLVMGEALGRSDQARTLVDDVEAQFAAVREEHPEFVGASAVLAYGGPEGYGAYASEDTRARFLAELGFELPQQVDELAGDSFYTALSQEHFRLIDRELVLMYGPQAEIEGDEVFGRLDAVKEDRVVYLDLTDDIAGALGFASVLSLPYLLDEAVPALAAAVDGDPATEVSQPR